jgi:hypothetical protein
VGGGGRDAFDEESRGGGEDAVRGGEGKRRSEARRLADGEEGTAAVGARINDYEIGVC